MFLKIVILGQEIVRPPLHLPPPPPKKKKASDEQVNVLEV